MIRSNASIATLILCAWTVLLSVTGCGPQRDRDVASNDASDVHYCFPPSVMCGNDCINPQNDIQNCGTCGNVCAGGLGCVDGACTMQCPLPQAACGGICTDTNTDRANCGACGFACANGLVCSMGLCVLDCGAGLTTCTAMPSTDGGVRDAGDSRYCADTRVDQRNCGACGNSCAAGMVCTDGACVTACPAGQMACDGECVDVMTNPAHCGACGAACPGGQGCVDGACTMSCPAGQNFCTDRCTDVQGDRANCGACGHACAAGEVCAAGTCAFACTPDRVNCSMNCVDTNTDRTNCGACGVACATGQACVAGACRPTCVTGTTACGANCVDLTNDHANCGSCGNACSATQFCVGGACGASCLSGQTVCGGVCVDLQVDNNNCGYCGGQCGAGYGCLAGYCRPLVGTDASGCTPPSRQCGATCTDTRNDNNNCGACGTICSVDRTCYMGMCIAPCTAGQARCGTTCTDVQFDRTNCGACGNVCAAGLGCVSGACVADPTFRIESLGATGCSVVDVGRTTGGDSSGIAVSASHVLLNGPVGVGVFDAGNLGTPMATTASHETLVGDMRDGSAWVLLDAQGHEPDGLTNTALTITQLGRVDTNTGLLTSTRVALSQSIPVDGGRAYIGLFGGFGRIIVHGGTGTAGRWWMIRMPTGEVTPLATRAAPLNNGFSFGVAYVGIAEFFAGEPSVVYVEDFETIVRYRISDGMRTTIGTWSDLDDMSNIAFSPTRNRWYFHHTFTSQFQPDENADQTLGFCPGTFSNP